VKYEKPKSERALFELVADLVDVADKRVGKSP
jgi:hypothetical protein